jgi:uncharacterized membrane protein (UPF0127 family)
VRLTTSLKIGDQKLTVYRATNPREWQQGLLGHSLAEVDGMLFTFSADVRHPFHMRGMPVPVLLCFFSDDGTFLELAYLNVGAEPYRHALELVGHHATIDGAIELLDHVHEGLDLDDDWSSVDAL